MKVLLTGAGGQVGRELRRVFGQDDLLAVTRQELDITDEIEVAETILAFRPNVVVNSAAWTDVDACEADEKEAHRQNATGPWNLARACARRDATLVHISTDYVFSDPAPVDDRGEPRGWTESDRVSPVNAYGRSKAAGEQLIREALDRHCIVRTSWVNGSSGANFVRTMLRLARERGRVEVVDDQIGSPTFAHDLAGAIRELVLARCYGTVHRTNSGSCSWLDLATATFELADLEVAPRRTTSDRLVRPAPRPRWSVLDNGRATTLGLSPIPSWREGLHRTLIELGEATSSS
jgi:dTDP-4-dehydrorhamnose reductase